MSFWADITSFFTHFTQADFDKLVADVQQAEQVVEDDLKKAAAFIVANGPAIIQDAETLVAILAALSGNLTIPSSVISALKVAITDAQQFVDAVAKASGSTPVAAFGAVSAFGTTNTQVVMSGYKVHQDLVAAAAAGRQALATAQKVKK